MAPNSTGSISSKADDVNLEDTRRDSLTHTDEDVGGHEARLRLERKLVGKLDLRMSILVVIYILNYVRMFQHYRRAEHSPTLCTLQIDRNNAS